MIHYQFTNNRKAKKIKQAYLQTDASHKLEDILISQGNFKTIKYNDTIEKYNNKYHQSEKVYNILKTLGETRNMITHFGIDNTDNWNEFVITILNTFDVIYNYLYPQLIELDEIGDYFTTDDIMVDTIHGKNCYLIGIIYIIISLIFLMNSWKLLKSIYVIYVLQIPKAEYVNF